MFYTMKSFQSLNRPECMVMTQHCRKRFAERNISVEDIIQVIDTGCIIETYPEDFPVPSCLILGYSGNRAIHICASIMDDYIYLITAYIPDPEKWDDDWRTRKGESE